MDLFSIFIQFDRAAPGQEFAFLKGKTMLIGEDIESEILWFQYSFNKRLVIEGCKVTIKELIEAGVAILPTDDDLTYTFKTEDMLEKGKRDLSWRIS